MSVNVPLANTSISYTSLGHLNFQHSDFAQLCCFGIFKFKSTRVNYLILKNKSIKTSQITFALFSAHSSSLRVSAGADELLKVNEAVRHCFVASMASLEICSPS